MQLWVVILGMFFLSDNPRNYSKKDFCIKNGLNEKKICEQLINDEKFLNQEVSVIEAVPKTPFYNNPKMQFQIYTIELSNLETYSYLIIYLNNEILHNEIVYSEIIIVNNYNVYSLHHDLNHDGHKDIYLSASDEELDQSVILLYDPYSKNSNKKYKLWKSPIYLPAPVDLDNDAKYEFLIVDMESYSKKLLSSAERDCGDIYCHCVCCELKKKITIKIEKYKIMEIENGQLLDKSIKYKNFYVKFNKDLSDLMSSSKFYSSFEESVFNSDEKVTLEIKNNCKNSIVEIIEYNQNKISLAKE